MVTPADDAPLLELLAVMRQLRAECPWKAEQTHESLLAHLREETDELIEAVEQGSVDDVCERYGLTVEEFAGWQRAIDRSGMPGLRVTRIQHYKSLYERQQKY